MVVISMLQIFLRPSMLALVLIGTSEIVGAQQVDIELKCSADKFYSAFKNNMMQLPAILPHIYKSSKMVKGNGQNSVGSMRQWEYILPGSSNVTMTREVIKSMDEDKKSITFHVLGGDVMAHYKSFEVTVTVTPKDVDNIEQSGSQVKWWMEYEKRTKDVGSPDGHIAFFAQVTKELGYLLQ